MRYVTTFRLYMVGLALLFGVYVVVESHRPKPLDWTPTYINTDKIPYGTYALFDQLPRLLGTDSIEVVRQPAYNQLTGTDEGERPGEEPIDASILTDSLAAASRLAKHQFEREDNDGNLHKQFLPIRNVRANYLFISNEGKLLPLEQTALLEFVRNGNAVFIAAEEILYNFDFDTLGIGAEQVARPLASRRPTLVPDSVELRFTNPALAASRCRLPASAAQYRFVLKPGHAGHTLATDGQGRPVYVELPFGRGHFYFCAVPAAFSNRYFLQPRSQPFAVAALRYLPARRTFWDEYQKQGPTDSQSLLRVLMAHEPLRLAYFLTLAGAVLFMVMGARRRQRIIPTINPLPNTTLLFTRTVAGLYRQGRSHGLIAEKKVSLFVDYLRTRFQEPSPDFGDEQFRERLSQKSGVPRPRVDELLRLVNFARTAPQMTDAQLLKLSTAVNDFKREAQR
ncbi:MAG: hypothetical protein M3Y12_04085 [Bacteroidota bacterium]|nr:hypothetical protein [Bacteroidota bacterium]